MSMRENPVSDYGLVLNCEEFSDLIKNNYFGENREEVLEDLDCGDIMDIMYAYFEKFYSISQFTGELEGIRETENKYFEDDEIYVLPFLKADSLFDKYENMEEIYNEIKEEFEYMNLKFDLDFVKKHIGKVIGSYWG